MLIVQKYGGSSVANAERVFNVAKRILATQKEGNDVVVFCPRRARQQTD